MLYCVESRDRAVLFPRVTESISKIWSSHVTRRKENSLAIVGSIDTQAHHQSISQHLLSTYYMGDTQ